MRYRFFIWFILFVSLLLSCSEKKVDELEDNGDVMPSQLTWKYSGEQCSDGSEPFRIELFFRAGVIATLTYGIDLNKESQFARQSLLWKMVDDIVYIYLDKNVYPDADKDLYIKGKILEDNLLEVSWEDGLGEFWDTNAAKNNWLSSMVLELTELNRDNTDCGLWHPWTIPGFEDTYGIP